MRLTHLARKVSVVTLLGLAALLGDGGWPRMAWGQDEMFVANVSGSITVYGRTASGDTGLIRTLTGDATGLNFPNGVVVDTANNELVIANDGGDSITVYSRLAGGNIAPLRTLTGAATGLSGPEGIAV